MNANNLTQKTLKEYNELRKEYTENECELFFGGFQGLKEIIKEGQLTDLWNWLLLPAEDWQKDC
jgi:hypothetical protein